MDVNSESFIKELETVLQEEIRLYSLYTELLEQERDNVIKFNAEKVTELTAKRADIYDQLVVCQQTRKHLTECFPEYRNKRLYELVIKNIRPVNAKRVTPLILKLREVVQQSSKTGNSFSRILGFSLKSVSGVLSIIWSATQTVVKSYNRKGRIQNSYHPSDSRNSGLLRKA